MAEGAPAPAALQKVKASGFLWKKGHRVKNWKRRWFILRDAYLAYFEAPTKTNVRAMYCFVRLPMIQC